MASDEKKCPFCAEIIKAEAIKCRFCGSDLVASRPAAPSPPSFASSSPLACSKCGVELVAVQKRKAVSASGIVSVVVFLVGLVTILGNVIVGAVLMILALVIGMAGSKKTVMVCPNCGLEGLTL